VQVCPVCFRQGTVARSVRLSGTGLHSGVSTRLEIHPAVRGSGIVFRRLDCDTLDPIVPARFSLADRAPLRTRLVNAAGVGISTTEHLLSALWMTGITNASIDVDGPEIPDPDGAALAFCALIDSAGKLDQGPDRPIVLTRPVSVRIGDRIILAEPHDGFEIEARLVYDNPGIGTQCHVFHGAQDEARSRLACCRTFCLEEDLLDMRRRGRANGGHPDNVLVFSADGEAHGAIPRGIDEPVRHKVLDMIGDLVLLGAPLRARIRAVRPGHLLTLSFMEEIARTPSAWEHGAA